MSIKDITYEDFTDKTLKGFKVKELKSFVVDKLIRSKKLSKKQDYIDFLLENKEVVFGNEKQKNTLPKLSESRTKIFSETEVVVGIDEAGYGCCVGDLYIGFCILPKHHDDTRWNYLNDSKSLSENIREVLFDYIKEIAIEWHIERVTPKEIDKLNIYQARLMGFERGLNKLKTKLDHILIDGNVFCKFLHNKELDILPSTCVIGGDKTYKSIAAASILAKVQRDRDIMELAKDYPEFDWDKNKGYCQIEHMKLIDNYGVTEHHRLSYNPCKNKKKFVRK